jgi:hypothetical protein
MIGLAEAPLKERPNIPIFCMPHEDHAATRAVVLIGVADAPEVAADFITNVQKMENGHMLDGVDDDLGEKFIWQ